MNKELLDLYSDYLISQTRQAAATGLAELLESHISHDKVTRFLHAGGYGHGNRIEIKSLMCC